MTKANFEWAFNSVVSKITAIEVSYVCTYKVICLAISNDPRMDSSVRQLIWNGAIPLEIHIDDPENIYILNSQLNLIAILKWFSLSLRSIIKPYNNNNKSAEFDCWIFIISLINS